MTAEIGVMNKTGVSLAADSAVTLGNSNGKIYQSANKLFQVSKQAPVGIMVYGSATLLDVPWETVIKMYRVELGAKTYAGLRDYEKEFVDYLDKNRELFDLESQKNYIYSLSCSVFKFLYNEVLPDLLDDALKEKAGQITEKEVKGIFQRCIVEELELVKEIDVIGNMPKTFRGRIRKEYKALIIDAINRIFEDFPLTKSDINRLASLIVELLIRRWPTNERYSFLAHSGIVIAGFGSKEHYPSLSEVKIQGIVLDRLIYYESGSAVIDNETTASVRAFAQGEMVATFMSGIDPELSEWVLEKLIDKIKLNYDTIIKRVTKKYPEVEFEAKFLESIAKEAVSDAESFIEEFESISKKQYSDPVMEIIASLPKDELAEIAGALVNLTKFKRRISNQLETVGGPIDVAVISKGDGFVWISRKHYFKPELNIRYLINRIRKDGYV